MKSIAMTLATLVSLSAAASAQERSPLDREISLSAGEDSESSPGEPQVPGRFREIDADALALPRSLSAIPPQPVVEMFNFSIGAASGYLRAHNSDQGTWFGGVQARLRMGYFAAEASIQFHQNRFQGGDVIVTQYPVQLTAFLYLIPEGPIRPYILGGVGWYYTRVDHRGVFAGIPDYTDHVFGEHLGGGAELFLAPRFSVDADLRYIFLNPTTDAVIGGSYNYWQITLGANILF